MDRYEFKNTSSKIVNKVTCVVFFLIKLNLGILFFNICVCGITFDVIDSDGSTKDVRYVGVL